MPARTGSHRFYAFFKEVEWLLAKGIASLKYRPLIYAKVFSLIFKYEIYTVKITSLCSAVD